jgi:C1A family cysteine protease
MFGFTIYSCYRQAGDDGAISYPTRDDSKEGGHAVVAAGYDDDRRIQNSAPGCEPTIGAILIRNSWGPAWGDGGYGWLPYDYLRKRLARDWWSLIKSAWVDSTAFDGDSN